MFLLWKPACIQLSIGTANSASGRRNIMDQGSTRDWRELCKAASKEPDPKKLMSLVDEIIKMLDDRNRICGSLQTVRRPEEQACENGVSL